MEDLRKEINKSCLESSTTKINQIEKDDIETSKKMPPKRYACTVNGCEKTYHSSWHLKGHIRSQHTGERPFVCQWPLCGKDFARSDKLYRHMNIHTKEINKSCPESSTTKINQIEEDDIETSKKMPPKRYACTINGCEKTYHTSWHLKGHIRSQHTGERPFVCQWPLCGKDFARSDKLYRHMNTHTKQKLFSCPCCDKSFTRNYLLKRHMKDFLEVCKQIDTIDEKSLF